VSVEAERTEGVGEVRPANPPRRIGSQGQPDTVFNLLVVILRRVRLIARKTCRNLRDRESRRGGVEVWQVPGGISVRLLHCALKLVDIEAIFSASVM
jgi:hypothetical protein